MATFGVFDDVKLGLRNTFEKMRHKLQKNAAKMMVPSSASSNENGSKYDYYSPVSQNETAPLDGSSSNNYLYNDIGLLPLERDSSCLQDVLERNGCSRGSCDNDLVEKFASDVAVSKSKVEACLVDLNDEQPQKSRQLFVPPPVGAARSLSNVVQQNTPLQTVQRSLSLSTQPSSQGQDLFDVFSPPPKNSNPNNGNFANFGDFGAPKTREEPDTLKPVPVNSLAGCNNGSPNQDPFASIFGDFQPQQHTQNVPKQKVTLGDLAGNSSCPTFIPPPLSFLQPPMLNKPSPPSTVKIQHQQPSSNGKEFNLLDDVFDQLGFLKQQSNGSNQKTMRDLQKDDLAQKMADDPEALKVRQWVDGKQGNIRALLSTLEQILWDEESRSRWEPIPIHQLVKVNDVRKAYKRAVVVCHPDKLVGTQYERISRLVFVELNEASSEFQKELEQSGSM